MARNEPPAAASVTPTPQFVADEFRKKYCEVLAKHPKYMHRFYHDNSQVSLRITSSGPQPTALNATGLEEIQELFNQHLSSSKILSTCCVAQSTMEGSILLLTSGCIKSNPGGPLPAEEMSFSQTILLAPQPSGFYVLNDVLYVHPAAAAVATPVPLNGVAAAPSPVQAPAPTAVPAVYSQPAAGPPPPHLAAPAAQQAAGPPAAPAAALHAPPLAAAPTAAAAAAAAAAGRAAPPGEAPMRPPGWGMPQQPAAVALAPVAAAAAAPTAVEPAAPAAPVTPKAAAASASQAAAAAAASAAEPPSSSTAAAEPVAVSGWGPLPGSSQPAPDSKPAAEPAAAAADVPQQPLTYAERLRMSSQRAAATSSAPSATRTVPAPGAAAAAAAAPAPKAAGATPAQPAAAGGEGSSGTASAAGPAAAAGAAADGESSYRPDLVSSLDAGEEALGVFLRGIPAATTEEELHGVFGKFGNIVKVAIIPSRTYDTNTAYVDYDTTEAVQAAMDAYGSDRGEGNEEKLVHRLSLRGKSVTVLLKLPRTLRLQPVTMGGRGGDFRRGPPGSYNRGGYGDGGRGRAGGRGGDMRQPNGGRGDMGGRMGGSRGRDGLGRGERSGPRGGSGSGTRPMEGRGPRAGEGRA